MKHNILWIIITAFAIAMALVTSGYFEQDSDSGDNPVPAADSSFNFSTN